MACTLGMKSVRSNWNSWGAPALLCALLLASSAPAHAATENVLYTFTGGSDSDMPTGPLTLYNGNLYGTTQGSSFQGGTGPGAVYELSPNGAGGWKESTLYTFCSLPGCADGEYPNDGALLFDSLGNIYGATQFGGAYGYGTIFELSLADGNWTETVLYSFANNGDGAYPVNPGFFDSAGNLYGTMFAGGFVGNNGGVFELSPSGGGGWTEQLIYSDAGTWSSVTPDGSGDIFGTSATTVFKLSPNGGGWTPTTVFTFTNATKDGSGPNGTLVFDKTGHLYGTTVAGGKSNAGTVFELTPVLSGKKKGTFTEKLLWSFKGGPKDGANPYGAVVFDSAGNIYGATVGGGKNGYGAVYELAFTPTTGKYKEKVLWSFTGTAGANPGAQGWVPLIPDGQGNFYSVTVVGGTDNFGLAFELIP